MSLTDDQYGTLTPAERLTYACLPAVERAAFTATRFSKPSRPVDAGAIAAAEVARKRHADQADMKRDFAPGEYERASPADVLDYIQAPRDRRANVAAAIKRRLQPNEAA